jgi:ApbE superfamily uncharacterized protein (UPF0280 family)
MMAAMIEGELDKAYVNNGGDIALHISPGQSLTLAVGGTGHGFADRITVDAEAGVRGVATSGWRGRSFSLGIADAVTVLARTAAEADGDDHRQRGRLAWPSSHRKTTSLRAGAG